jgi:hypothetical protein
VIGAWPERISGKSAEMAEGPEAVGMALARWGRSLSRGLILSPQFPEASLPSWRCSEALPALAAVPQFSGGRQHFRKEFTAFLGGQRSRSY